MSTDREGVCPICNSFPHKLTCPNGVGVIKISVDIPTGLCGVAGCCFLVGHEGECTGEVNG